MFTEKASLHSFIKSNRVHSWRSVKKISWVTSLNQHITFVIEVLLSIFWVIYKPLKEEHLWEAVQYHIEVKRLYTTTLAYNETSTINFNSEKHFPMRLTYGAVKVVYWLRVIMSVSILSFYCVVNAWCPLND